jgi:hypothetical protein
MSEEALLVASGSENKVHLKDRDVEIPVDYYPLAVFFLVCMQDSPFYREKDPQFNDADILTAECIERGAACIGSACAHGPSCSLRSRIIYAVAVEREARCLRTPTPKTA